MNLLFWNLKNNSNEQLIADCIVENNIDIALFAEHASTNFDYICQNLLSNFFCEKGAGGCDKIIMLANKSIVVDVKQEQNRYVLYTINNLNMLCNLCCVHLQDRRNSDFNKRKELIGRLVNDIKNLEDRENCNSTIIIGDVNANPYDHELLDFNGFNAVLFKDIIKKSESITIDGIKYRRFYNPIIHFLSEDEKNYGSFYISNTTESNNPIWNCLDQVIVSKPLIDSVSSMRYLRKIKQKELIKKTKPDNSISDHLPLVVQLKENVYG